MRLTLRTLLAYLDDVLEPAEAREIGRKLQESPVATALVSRLREVMRRRRIGSPELTGPGAGIDPNLVAQYLDNTLPPELVGDVEKVCLESDVQLAEVAACHQILTLALGEPVDISPGRRERIYVLGPVDAADKLQAGSDGVHRGNGERALPTATVVRTVVPGSAGQSFEATLPEHLRSKPWSGRLVAVAVGLLLLAVWVGAFLSDRSTREFFSRAPDAVPPATRPVEPDETSEAELVAQAEAAEAEPATPIQHAPADAEQPSTPEVIPNVAIVQPEDLPADAWLVAEAVSTPRPAIPAPPETDVPEPPPPPRLPVVTATYVSPEGVLLQQIAGDPNWYLVPRASVVKPGTRLACPEPFEAVLEFNHGSVRVMLLSDTVVDVAARSAEAPVSLRLVRGRIILAAGKSVQEAWPLGFAIADRSGILELGDSELLLGIELLPQSPVGFEQPVAPTLESEGMYVVTGDVVWTAAGAAARTAGKGMYLSLLTDQPPLNFGPPISTLPGWLDPQRRKTDSPLRRYAKSFEKEFEPNRPVDSDLRALIRDPRPKISELAVRGLALTDNYAAVVQALAQAEHEDTRKAAMTGLCEWLGVSADRGPLLRQALAMYYERDEQVAALDRLLWGISLDEAKQESPSYEILEWLRSDRVEIRELTIANLERLTRRNYGYRPLATATQREPAVRRWFEHVTKEGGIVSADDVGKDEE